MSVLFADVNPLHLIGYPNRDKVQREPIYLGTVRIDTNHDSAILDNVTWFPYSPTDKYNESGRNGYIEGTIRSGTTTSRLFQYTHSTPWKTGEIKRIDYAHLDKITQHFTYKKDGTAERIYTGDLECRSHTCG